MNLKKMDLDTLLLMFEGEIRPGQLTQLANEIAERADSLALESLTSKYTADLPKATKTAILNALGSITVGAPVGFFEKILQQEVDMKQKQLKALFMAMCNGSDHAKVHDISSGMSDYAKRKGWQKMAKRVMDEVFPDTDNKK